MTVLVPGALGFLGGHVTDLLLARAERVRVVIRPGEDGRRLAAAGADVDHFDISRACSKLGFTPAIRLAEGIQESISWYRAAHYPASWSKHIEELSS